MNIPFTQFLRPHGRRNTIMITFDRVTEAKASLILAAGYQFQCEELTTGHASFTIFDPTIQEDVAIKICPNGPDVPATVTALIMDFQIPGGKS